MLLVGGDGRSGEGGAIKVSRGLCEEWGCICIGIRVGIISGGSKRSQVI